ncbi:MAG: TIGR02757 family protein [Alistipes sp.]|jgi:uncharacterized protein (TIGR02757 family)|nr:TIGR02757 family protein [Alistipes sp.]
MNGAISCDGLGELLIQLHDRYNTPDFIEADPISIPHRFFLREGVERLVGDAGAAVDFGGVPAWQKDVEIAGFLAATIAWGNRKAIVKSAGRMVDLMEGQPYDFVMNASPAELDGVTGYVHRTFNGGDFRSFLLALRHIYSEFGSMGAFFEGEYLRSGDLRRVISRFREEFFSPPHAARCEKHLSSIDRGAACKRTCMFLRWMVRRDDRGVDFGLWRGIPAAALYLPLDVHSAATARSMGLLTRRQNDWKAVEEVTARLWEFSAEDPAKFDFALFGVGISGVGV